MARYKLSERADADLDAIYRYGWMTFGEADADSYYDQLIEKLKTIAAQPFLYPYITKNNTTYRRCVFKAHSIFYRCEGEEVLVVRILGRQDEAGALH